MMIDKQLIANLKLLHGLYNSIVFIMILYQGFLGLRIRKERRSGRIYPHDIKKHRRLGPILTFVSPIGFFAGVSVVYLDYGHIFKYPLHFIMGFFIMLSVFMTFLVSKRIISNDELWRKRHYILGILIISFYIIQVTLGLSIFL